MRLFGLFFLLLLAVQAQADTPEPMPATLRGYVSDLNSGQPLQDAAIVLTQNGEFVYGTVTDEDGFFAITRIRQGQYIVTASYIGYKPVVDTLRLLNERTYTLNITMAEDAELLDELVVEAESVPTAARVTAGKQTVRPVDIELVPGPDVAGDLATYLTALPGIVSLGDRGGQVFIRGGEPSHNMVLIDGMFVHQPFHVLGFYSAIPSGILQSADIYAGGYGSQYSGRVSSVVDVRTRNGNKKKMEGKVSLAPFVSSVQMEGPIVPNRLSYLVSARKSAVEAIASKYINQPMPYEFGDVFAKVHGLLDRDNHLSLTFLHTFDRGDISASLALPDQVRWKNTVLGGRYLLMPENLPIRIEWLFSVSRMQSEVGPRDVPIRTSEIYGFHTGINATIFAGNSQIKWGFFLRDSNLPLQLGGLYQNLQVENSHVPKAAMYVEPDIYLGNGLRIRPGIALQIAAASFSIEVIPEDESTLAEVRLRSGTEKIAEPRIRVIWEQGQHQFSGAWGLYHQELAGLNDRRDATSVFTAWTATPTGTFTRARHLILGYRNALSETIEVSIEGFNKRLKDLYLAEWSPFPVLGTEVQNASGNVSGLDVRFEYRRPNVYGYLTYGLSKVRYTSTQPELAQWYGVESLDFRPPHDRRHQVNFLISGRWKGFDGSLRWHYGSGLPYTQVQGFDGFVLLNGPVDVFEEPYQERVFYDRPYGATLPAYHRLDISVERKFFFNNSQLTVQAGAINLYNRSNIFALDTFTLERTNQLPFVPTIGLELAF